MNSTNKTYSCLRAVALRRASVSFVGIRVIRYHSKFDANQLGWMEFQFNQR
jgi:hypothetical protein